MTVRLALVYGRTKQTYAQRFELNHHQPLVVSRRNDQARGAKPASAALGRRNPSRMGTLRNVPRNLRHNNPCATCTLTFGLGSGELSSTTLTMNAKQRPKHTEAREAVPVR